MKDEKERIKMYKNLAEHLLCQIYTKENLKKMKQTIKEKDQYTKQYSCGGQTISRGYYCLSLIEEIIVTNVTRGKLLKQLTKKSRPDYCYYFDEDKMVLVQSNFSDEKRFYRYEWIYRDGDLECSIQTTLDDIEEQMNEDDEKWFEMITCSTYEEDRVVSNAFLSCYLDPDNFVLLLEEYKYNQKKQLVSAVMTNASVSPGFFNEDVSNLDFVYDAEGSLMKCIINGDESEDDPVRIPPTVRELITGETQLVNKKALTEAELSRELKKAVKEWKGEDIYAISVFINHDGDEVTDFAVSYNPEENQEGEERWNYACWDQDEESLMYLLDEKDADWKKLLDLCAKSVCKLQQNQFFSKLFSQDIPVIIHGYEYAEEELEATRKANPAGQADEFFEAMKDLGIVE